MTTEEKLRRLDAVVESNARQSKPEAMRRLVKTGIYTPKGNLTRAYGGTRKKLVSPK